MICLVFINEFIWAHKRNTCLLLPRFKMHELSETKNSKRFLIYISIYSSRPTYNQIKSPSDFLCKENVQK